MRTAIALILMVPLSACGSASQEKADDAAAANGSAAPNAANAPGQSRASGQSNAAGGTWSGTVHRKEEHTTLQSGEGTSSKITQTYEATITIRATAVDSGRWEIAGPATVIGTFSSNWISNQSTPLGPCNVHYTDDAQAKATGVVEGGMEIDDDLFQLRVQVPGADGTMSSVRDDSGCRGTNTSENNPWAVSEQTLTESGKLTDPNVISVTRREPDPTGVVTTTWNLRRTP
jgi:hypothetical protein